MKEFIEILFEVVKLLDRLLDLDEKELDFCSLPLHNYIVDFRNAMARFANLLQRKNDREEQRKEKATTAPYVITDDEDADEDAAAAFDYADENLYIKRARRTERGLEL